MTSTRPVCLRAQSYRLVIFSRTASGQETISGWPVQPLPVQVPPEASAREPVPLLQLWVNLPAVSAAVP